jgi:ribosomal protein S18 acetylase RimI-like enzyme
LSSEYTLRLMLPTDEAKVKEIIDLSFSAFMGFFALRSVRSEGQVLVCEAHGAVLGFAKIIDFKIGGEKFGCILWIAVHPKFRRKGVARTKRRCFACFEAKWFPKYRFCEALPAFRSTCFRVLQ